MLPIGGTYFDFLLEIYRDYRLLAAGQQESRSHMIATCLVIAIMCAAHSLTQGLSHGLECIPAPNTRMCSAHAEMYAGVVRLSHADGASDYTVGRCMGGTTTCSCLMCAGDG